MSNNKDKYVIRNAPIDFVEDAESVGSSDATRSINVNSVVDMRNNELSRKTEDFLAKVRGEANRIVAEARGEAEAIKKETLAAIEREHDALERRAAELEKVRKTLESDLEALEERRTALESDAFEKAQKDGFEQGKKEGFNEGYRKGEEKANEELEARIAEGIENRVQETASSALEPLQKLVREMRESRQALLKNWEENILQVAAIIAFQAILREPSLKGDVPVELLREALELAMNSATLKVRMNPTDVATLKNRIKTVLEETGNLAKTEIVPDSTITRGGCVVETGLGVIDERLESRLQRIVEELSE